MYQIVLPNVWGVYISILSQGIVEVCHASGISRWEDEAILVIGAAAELSITLQILIANERIVRGRSSILR
jgi:hypothetical protein